jgi:hypothetical protein
MADTKISALTSATTPVAGTEVLPIVQSSTTKQVSIANLTAGRSVSGTSFVPTGSTVPANGLYLPAANSVGFATNSTEAARIDSSGNFLVGNGSTPSSSNQGTQFRNLFNVGAHQISQGAATANTYIDWINANGTIGSIAASGSITLYNTTSDYRLKENVTPMTGALSKIASLKPVTYKWKVDGADGEGFIAHELAEVCPQAVHGKKDAIDEDGNPKYQSMDSSFLIATLAAAIQEQQTLITDLTARVAVLESK